MSDPVAGLEDIESTADKQRSRNNVFVCPSPSDETFVFGRSITSSWSDIRDQIEDKSDVSGGSPVEFSDDDRCLRQGSRLMSSTVSEVSKTKIVDLTTGVSLQGSRMAGSRGVMDCTGEIVLPNLDNFILPSQPPKNILSDLTELPSDIERIQIEEMKNSGGPELPVLSVGTLQPEIQTSPGGQFHSLQGCDGVSPSPPPSFHSFSSSSLQLSQCSDSSLESASYMRNSPPAGTYSSTREPDEAGRAAGLSGDSRSLSQVFKREIAELDFADNGEDTQGLQGPLTKIPRLANRADRAKKGTSDAVPAGGVESSSGTNFKKAWRASASQRVEFRQPPSLQPSIQDSGPPSEQPAVPPAKACRPDIKNKLGQKILKNRAEKGQGPVCISWDPKPECELTDAEKERIEKRRLRNKETARKAREKQKNLETTLQTEVDSLNETLRQANDDIHQLSKQRMKLQNCLSAHNCRGRPDHN